MVIGHNGIPLSYRLGTIIGKGIGDTLLAAAIVRSPLRLALATVFVQ